MTEADWIKLAFLCLAGAATPGLSWLLILSMSASRGIKVGVSGALGHGLGITAFASITVFGLSALLIAVPELTSVFTLFGIGLLVFFGYRLLTAGISPLPERLTTQVGFIAGFSIAILNPKVLIFFLAVFGPLVDPTHSASTQILMGILAGGVDAGVYLGIAIAGSTLRTLLNGARIQRMNQVIGGLLLISGLWILGKEIPFFV